MRKIAANYIMPVSSPPLRNGIVVTDEDGSILEVIDTGGKLRESSHLEFHNGIITPGFVLPWYRSADQANTLTEQEFGDFDRSIFQQGIKAIGIVERRAGHFAKKKESRVTYHTILELCVRAGQDEFEVYRQGIEIISGGWNEFNQACSLSCCTSSLMETDLAAYILQYAAVHRLVFPMENADQWTLPEQLACLKKHMERVSEGPAGGIKGNAHLVLVEDRGDQQAIMDHEIEEVLDTFHSPRPKQNLNILETMLEWQGSSSQLSLLDVLPAFTLNAAEALFEDDALGSIEPGKTPGLNLISNTEPGTFRLSRKSTFRVLV
jgi:hypothetical protein